MRSGSTKYKQEGTGRKKENELAEKTVKWSVTTGHFGGKKTFFSSLFHSPTTETGPRSKNSWRGSSNWLTLQLALRWYKCVSLDTLAPFLLANCQLRHSIHVNVTLNLSLSPPLFFLFFFPLCSLCISPSQVRFTCMDKLVHPICSPLLRVCLLFEAKRDFFQAKGISTDQ